MQLKRDFVSSLNKTILVFFVIFTLVLGTYIYITFTYRINGGATQTVTTNAPVFVITLLTLWSLAIYGFIFHRAMNMHIGFGIAMALFVVIFSVAITQTAITQ